MFCFNRSSGLYLLNQGHMTLLPLSVNKWFYTHPPPRPPSPPPPLTTSGLSTPLTRLTIKTLHKYLKCIKNFKKVSTIRRHQNIFTGYKWSYFDFPVSCSTSLISKYGYQKYIWQNNSTSIDS